MIWLLLISCYAPYNPEDEEPGNPPEEPEREPSIEDSALVTLGYVGEVDLSVDWAGIEAVVVNRAGNGELLCLWGYGSNGTSSIVAPCLDPDGGACLFAFDVSLTGGQQLDGDCHAFSTLGEEAGPFSYGYIDDYTAGGISYGPALLFYYRYDGAWRAVPGSADFDPETSQLDYRWDRY